MRNKQLSSISWFNSLSRIISAAEKQPNNDEMQQIDDRFIRIELVARIRWVLLGLFALYGFFAAASFSLSSLGFCFTARQTSFLILTVIAVVLYNVAIGLSGTILKRFPYPVHVQIFLDLVFVTALIHLTGGVVSWFWPVYLLVTLESAFLCDNKKEVWLIGAVGATLYGTLLALENLRILAPIAMPFINDSLHDVFLFQLLMWIWVAGINATVAVIAAFLMDTIRRDHRQVKDSEEALMGFIAAANDLIFCCDVNGVVMYANQACQDALGIRQDEFGGISIVRFLDEAAFQDFKVQSAKVTGGELTGFLELQLKTVSGELIDVEMSLSGSSREGGVPMIWGVCRDISERKRAQLELYKLAHHDILTGLPNRVLLQDRLLQAKAMSNRLNSCFSLMFIDLDRFKIINDTLGHSVGDELLRLVAVRLKQTLREIDTVARIGGDEFIILLVNMKDARDVECLSEKIIRSLVLPFNLREHELFITTSMGICMYPDHGHDIDAMMKKADIAMYHAKSLGRNNYQFYDDNLDQNASRRFVISNSLRKGIEQNEFRVYYQPKVDVRSGQIVAMEALVRWEHPELGLLSPMEFIQLAEENGLIMQLGEWVLREACSQNMKWHSEGIEGMRVAVNLSGYQVQHRNLLDTVKRVIEETGIAPEQLELEITESVLMQNPDFAVTILTLISDLGIHISIDDFGTGYSSLAHLKRFTVNTIKIDKSFVRDVHLSSTDAAIATAIIAMGNSLNLNVIAEGVEMQAQYDFLRDNNCDQVQGFLFSRPLPADEFLEILRENRLNLEGSQC